MASPKATTSPVAVVGVVRGRSGDLGQRHHVVG